MKKIFAVLLFLGVCHLAHANGVAVSNVTLTGKSTANKTTNVQFDITWSNSWRGSINNDAAWVFVKFKKASDSLWYHAKLKTAGTNPTGFSRGTGTTVDILVPTDKVGCFIERSAAGAGTVSVTDIELVWDWGTEGNNLNSTDAISEVRVFAIEMVYVPTGSFYIGDGVSGTESTCAFHENGVDNTAVQITTSSKSITCDSSTNHDIDTSPVAVDGDGGITGNASWPTGYNAFYCMKYEVTQGQYRDFLNTLSTAQKAKRTATMTATKYVLTNTSTVSSRNGLYTADGGTIVCDFDDDGTGNEANDGEWIACNYLSWMDVSAYADWAGLRPMTELEYEKACRGSLAAVSGEYAWGTTTITEATTLSASGTVSEGVTETGEGLSNLEKDYAPRGAMRVGFAATGITSRKTAGAAYYGMMDMCGNVFEQAVSLGDTGGRIFQGTHGDGALTTTTSYEGNATNTDWAGISGTPAQGVTSSGSYATIARGGSLDMSLTYDYAKLSYRGMIGSNTRMSQSGGRAVRTAP